MKRFVFLFFQEDEFFHSWHLFLCNQHIFRKKMATREICNMKRVPVKLERL